MFTSCLRTTPFDQLARLPNQHPPSDPSLELQVTEPFTTISKSLELLYEFWYLSNDVAEWFRIVKVYIYYVAFSRRASRESISWNIIRFKVGLLNMQCTLEMLTPNEYTWGRGSSRDALLNQVRDSSCTMDWDLLDFWRGPLDSMMLPCLRVACRWIGTHVTNYEVVHRNHLVCLDQPMEFNHADSTNRVDTRLECGRLSRNRIRIP